MTGRASFSLTSIKTKAALLVIVALVVSIGLCVLTVILTVVPRVEDAVLASTRLTAENLAQEISKPLEMGVALKDLEGLSDKLSAVVASSPDLGYSFVVDEAGMVLFSSAKTPEPVVKAVARDGDRTEARQVSGAGEDFYDVRLPLKTGERTAGAVHLGLRAKVVANLVNPVITLVSLIGLLTFLAAAALIIFFIHRTVSGPLEHLTAAAAEITEGNLVAPQGLARRDEIGKLAESFGVMVGSLTTMVGRFRDTSDRLGGGSRELAEVSRRLSASFNRQLPNLEKVGASLKEMDRLSQDLHRQAQDLSSSATESSSSILETTANIGEITQNLGEINSAIENISAAIFETTATIKQIAQGAEDTASMAEATREAIQRINRGVKDTEEMSDRARSLAGSLKETAQESGSRSVRETLLGIRSIHEDVRHAEQALAQLEERVGSIGEVIGVIDDIADQTNLLALNAAIISAQAGDEGRSFAVVASEIRKLSASTSESTKKIADLIEGAQSEARNYASYLTRVSTSVEKGLALGGEAEKALERIIHSTDESARMANLIADTTRKQAQASEEVSRNVQLFTQRAEETRRATSEEAKGTELIRSSMERAKEMVAKVYRATEEQTKTSRLLSETSERAKEIASQLFNATEKEKQLAGEISQAMEEVRQGAQETAALVTSINTSSEMMTGMAGSLQGELGKYRTETKG